MKLLEYEAKAILHEYNVPVPDALLINENDTPKLNLPSVLKSQVPTGGRGKAGGIIKATNQEDVTSAIHTIFNLSIKGYKPLRILAEQPIVIKHEYYLLLIIDKVEAKIQLLANTNGGVDVEENDSDSFLRLDLDSQNAASAGAQLAEYFELPGQDFVLQDMVENLYRCFIQNDITLLEINPLMYTADDTLIAGDCKMIVDDAAMFRHKEWQFEDEPHNNNFVTLNPHGTIATIANGAGLAMATVDAVAESGMVPANFLDIGGGASSESVLKAFQKIMEYENINAIIINIFAGITRCDEVAKAVIEARRHIEHLPTLYIRLAGTNLEEAQEILKQHDITLMPTLEDCLSAAKQETSHG